MFKPFPFFLVICLSVAAAACEPPTRESLPTETGLDPVDPTAAVINSWDTKASVPSSRLFGVAGAANNIIYMVGGEDASGKSTQTVRAHTIATNSWSTKADIPRNRQSANGASFLNGRLYVSGGLSNTGGAARTLYAYNPGTNTWAKKANMPNPGACGAQGVINDRLYVYVPVGGSCGSVHGFYRYNPNTDSWASLPTPPSVHLSPVSGVIKGKFYLVGGSANASLAPNLALHVYTPATNSWTTKASLPSKQQNATGGALGGRLWVAGGINFTAPGVPPIPTLRVYDPATNSWSTRASMLTPRFYATGVNAGGKLWAISGFGEAGNSTKVEAYTP
jgi:N-acetylneuraminic acid mutarotase